MRMPEHATLGAFGVIFASWAVVFFGVLMVQQIPFTYRSDVCIVDSILWLAFSLVYFRLPKKYMPIRHKCWSRCKFNNLSIRMGDCLIKLSI